MSDPDASVDFAAPAVPPAQRSFLFHAKLISFFTFLSRLLGMAREAVAAHFFGAGLVWSAFTVAFTVPNLFRKLFGEGALSSAFIPLYANSIKHDHPREAHAFATASVNLLMIILIALTLVGELALYLTTRVWTMRPDRLLMIKLTAIMLPYVLLVCGTAFLGAILQVHRRFGATAAAPLILNAIHIAVIFFGARALHLSGKAPPDDPLVLARQTQLAYWLAFFVLVAGVLQIASLIPSLRAIGFRFHWVANFWTPTIKRMLKLSIPVALGAGVLQLSVLLDRFVSFLLAQQNPGAPGSESFQLLGWTIPYPLEYGAPARLSWAQFLYQFPLGVFAIALATAIFPGLSTHALDADKTKFRSTMRQGIEMALLEGLPASIGLIIVAQPAIRLLFQHGQFTGHATELVARSLIWYSAAIWAYSLQQIINRAYYALHDTTTPLIFSIVNIALNLVIEIPLLWTPLGEAGMAAGTCISFSIQSIFMLFILDRRVGGLELPHIARSAGKMLIATALMAAACYLVQKLPIYPHDPPQGSKAASFAQLVILMSTGGIVYFATCVALGLPVVEHLIPRRLRRKPSVPSVS